MTDLTTVDAFLAAFAERERTGLVDGPPWLREERRGALARFAARGLPTTRDEEWKYTSIAPIAAARFDLVADATGEVPAEEGLAPFLIEARSWNRLVFVNGRYVAKLSTIGPLPPGGRAGSLAEALFTDAEWIRPHLASASADERAAGFSPQRAVGLHACLLIRRLAQLAADFDDDAIAKAGC